MDHLKKIQDLYLIQNLNGTSETKITVSELQEIDKTQLWDFGFGNWDDNLVLLPLWILDFVQEGEVLKCINGQTCVVGKDPIDRDTRGGWIAYGYVPSGALTE